MKWFVIFVALLVLLAIPASAVDYVLTDLGRGEAFGINDLGHIVGWRPDPDGGPSKAFIWNKEAGFTDIGPSTSRAINNFDQVAGDGWIWSQEGGLVPLFRPDGSEGTASHAINNNGQIVGWERYAGGYDAVLWNNPYDNRTVLTRGWSYDINQNGTVVGEFDPSPGKDHAFLWSQATGFHDIGDFGTIFARADGINDIEQIVGQYHPGDDRHGFLWSVTEGLVDIGTLGGGHSHAIGINNRSQVVGNSMFRPDDPSVHAFVWTKAAGIQDLDILGGGNSGATDINEYGQIVGVFRDTKNQEHIALWEPVPEPISLLALGGGVVSLATRKRKRLRAK